MRFPSADPDQTLTARGPMHAWLAAGAWVSSVLLAVVATAGEIPWRPVPNGHFQLAGAMGERIQANIDHWLLRAPASNPGMIEMFRLRDRTPPQTLEPGAGASAGIYLVSGIQALPLDPRPQLRQTLASVVADLIAAQADDGYLGPLPRAARLKSGLDLWGHYHVMLALLMWHEATGDVAALQSVRRAADLVCGTFLNTGLRIRETGSPAMNLAIAHAFSRLHRASPETRYLAMLREIEKDLEMSGDYLRTGLAGIDFFKTPLPTWPSLHGLQGMAALGQISGDSRHRTAFLAHWQSILRMNRGVSGGFSIEGSTNGNAFEPAPIETCGTIAWMAMTADALALTADSRCADELEWSTWNAAAGAQHPSGYSWAHDTPLDGTRGGRRAGAGTGTPGGPDLDCCSVSGPRALGMLTEWAVMQTTDGIVVNWYGPGTFQGRLPDNTPVALKWETNYPLDGTVRLRVDPLAPRRFNLRLRIPAWSTQTTVALNNTTPENVLPGRYFELTRRWETGDRLVLQMDLTPRPLPGQLETAGRIAVGRGPLLLAWDQQDNPYDESSIPAVNPLHISTSRETWLRKNYGSAEPLAPWLILELDGAGGRTLRLRDFANAGSRGTRYRTWLPAKPTPSPSPDSPR